MESTPSSGSPAPAPLTRRAVMALDRAGLRSRRAQTFGLGALCGALGVALVIVVASIFAASAARPPLLPEQPVSEVRSTPRATPTPAAPTPTPTPTSTPSPDGSTDTADSDVAADPPVAPAPAPAPAPSQTTEPPADEAPVSPGNSGSAPGHTKPPKNP